MGLETHGASWGAVWYTNKVKAFIEYLSMQKTVVDIMEKKVVSVSPDMPVLDAARTLVAHAFDGVPVINNDNDLIGIFTQYDLIHFVRPAANAQDLAAVLINHVASMKVGDVMNTEPLIVSPSTSIYDLIQLFRNHHRVNPIPVTDTHGKLVGIVSRYDVIKILDGSAKA